MQIGDVIQGIASELSGYAYLINKALGVPGLFGQALLGQRTDTAEEVVLKTMRADRSADDRERFFEEGRTLTRVAAAEDQAGRHYAVRLLDQSAPEAPEIFLVLERATGQNVLEDLVDPVVDWQSAPLGEALALDIAWHFAQALRLAHQAGVCYDDMKLDNLFWNPAQPDDPLRVIDWNVTSSVAARGGVAGDWARFGARLYELRTGQRIGVSYDGTVLGAGPGGPIWQALPEGLRDLIEQALAMRYTDDDALLRDLRREREQAGAAWPELLERATIADGSGQAIEVLAPVSRAERQLHALPPDDAERQAGLATCADLRKRAVVRRGMASTRALESALQCLVRNEPRLAIERFQKAYNETGARDPRPRRWLWVAQLAAEQTERYRAVRANLDAGVEALNQLDLPLAAERLGQVCASDLELAPAAWLLAEATALAQAAAAPESAIATLDRLRDLFEQFPDLKALALDFQRQAAALERRRQALRHEQELWDAAQAELAAAAQAERAEAYEQGMRHCERALAALHQLLIGGCMPEREPDVRAARDAASAQLEWLTRNAQIAQIPTLANSPDPRQRRLALARAEQLVPTWAALPRLRKQIRQIDTCLAAIGRARAEPLIAPLDQAIGAIEALDRLGVKLDAAGADLRATQRELADSRAALADQQHRAEIQAARALLGEARDLLNHTRCDDALAILRQAEAQAPSPAVSAELAGALSEAESLRQLLERAAAERAAVDTALANNNLLAACRAAQRLAHAYPQLPSLAGMAAEIELSFWRQVVVAAKHLAAEFQQLSLRQATGAAVRALEVRAADLLVLRQSGEQLAALSAPAQQALRAEVDRACAALALAQEHWHQRRAETVAQLMQWLAQAEAACERGDSATPLAVLAEIRSAYLPADAAEQGLEAVQAHIARLDGALAERRDQTLGQLHDLDRRIGDASAIVWHDELAEIARYDASRLGPEARAAWEQVCERAARLRHDAERVQRHDLADIARQIGELSHGAQAGTHAAKQTAEHVERSLALLHDALQQHYEHTSHQLALLQQEDRRTAETLQLYQKIFTRTMAGFSVIVLVFLVLSITLTR